MTCGAVRGSLRWQWCPGVDRKPLYSMARSERVKQICRLCQRLCVIDKTMAWNNTRADILSGYTSTYKPHNIISDFLICMNFFTVFSVCILISFLLFPCWMVLGGKIIYLWSHHILFLNFKFSYFLKVRSGKTKMENLEKFDSSVWRCKWDTGFMCIITNVWDGVEISFLV